MTSLGVALYLAIGVVCAAHTIDTNDPRYIELGTGGQIAATIFLVVCMPIFAAITVVCILAGWLGGKP